MNVIRKSDTRKSGSSVYIPKAAGTGGLVLISQDWCGHCQRVKPELSKVASMTGNAFPIFIVNGDADPELVKDLGVRGFPTIFFIGKNGAIGEQYSDARTKEAFVKNICEKSRVCAPLRN